MTSLKQSRKGPTYFIVVWMVVNIVFMALELTLFNDAADPNNSLLLVFWIIASVSYLFVKKFGSAITVFVVIYAFSFNTFNLIYFGLTIGVINGISAIINLAVSVYLLSTMVAANRDQNFC